MSNDAEKMNDLIISDSSINIATIESDISLPSPSDEIVLNSEKNVNNLHMALTPPKKRKVPVNNFVGNDYPILPGAMNIESLANEIMINIFKFLPKKDLDICVLVNQRWKDIIHVHEQKFARRCINKFSIYSEFNPNLITFWGCSLPSKSQIHYVMDSDNNDGKAGIIQILNRSKIKCLVLGTIDLTESNIHLLLSILQKADAQVKEIQMRRVGLGNITAEMFHKFCEQINTKRYGFSDMLQAQNEHFGNDFFNTKIFREAKYLSVKGIVSDDAVVHVAVDDDTLLDFLFGKNIKSVTRKVACIEFPSISSEFVNKVLNRFTNEPDITHMVTEATLMSCTSQTVLQYPQFENILLGYANHASYNAAANKELQAELKKQEHNFVNVFLSVGERY